MLSRACEYAIQAVLYLAKQPDGQYTLIREISEKLDIPHYFLGKIMQILVRAGILISYKGPKGGLALARKSSEITPLDIVAAIDGTDFTHKCVIGLPKCDDTAPCPLHPQWGQLREGIDTMLSEKSLEALTAGLE